MVSDNADYNLWTMPTSESPFEPAQSLRFSPTSRKLTDPRVALANVSFSYSESYEASNTGSSADYLLKDHESDQLPSIVIQSGIAGPRAFEPLMDTHSQLVSDVSVSVESAGSAAISATLWKTGGAAPSKLSRAAAIAARSPPIRFEESNNSFERRNDGTSGFDAKVCYLDLNRRPLADQTSAISSYGGTDRWLQSLNWAPKETDLPLIKQTPTRGVEIVEVLATSTSTSSSSGHQDTRYSARSRVLPKRTAPTELGLRVLISSPTHVKHVTHYLTPRELNDDVDHNDEQSSLPQTPLSCLAATTAPVTCGAPVDEINRELLTEVPFNESPFSLPHVYEVDMGGAKVHRAHYTAAVGGFNNDRAIAAAVESQKQMHLQQKVKIYPRATRHGNL